MTLLRNSIIKFGRGLGIMGMISACAANEICYTPLAEEADKWQLGKANHAYEVPTMDAEHQSMSNTEHIAYGIYTFNAPIILKNTADRLDFSYILNIAYSGVPYGISPGTGILTLWGNTNIHAGLGGQTNGQFNAATSEEKTANCYSFYTNTQEKVEKLTPVLSVSDVIPSMENTTIQGHIGWDDNAKAFAVSFSIGDVTTESITLETELTFTELGITLSGPNSSTATFSDLLVTYHYAQIPEPGTAALGLMSILFIAIRRRKR